MKSRLGRHVVRQHPNVVDRSLRPQEIVRWHQSPGEGTRVKTVAWARMPGGSTYPGMLAGSYTTYLLST